MKKAISIIAAVAMATTMLAACGGSKSESSSAASTAAAGSESAASGDMTAVANKDKPLVWYNRQPSNSSTGELDKDALHYNDKTYYVGFDANQGAELQGQMIVDYIKKHAAEIDKNGDGTIGYVLAIGDIGHNDSIARTRGVRKALGTAVEKDGAIDSTPAGTNVDGTATVVKDGELEVDGKTYKVRELASQEMKNAAGATWDAATAGNGISTWASSFGDQIDIVASNNDGMGMSMFNLRVLRNLLDGVDVDTGIGTADEAGNVLTAADYKYVPEDRSYYALNLAVTADNYKDFTDATKAYAPIANKLDASKHASKKVWLNTYNAADNFLGSTYKPLLKNYAELLNLNVDYVDGDGQTESNITNRLGNPSQYDAFAINMVKTDNAASYTAILNQ